jgi:hypothetical protein
MSRTSRLLFAGACLAAFTNCDLKWSPDRAGNDDGQDRQEDELAQIAQLPSQGVCNGTRFRCKSQIRTDGSGHIKPFATPSGFGPADLASAYKLAGTTNGTIAIVDAYGYPNAESDLASYRSQFGLPPCTTANGCFKKVNQSGATSPLPSAPPAGDDWTVEAALDLDMASAACPNCKLILVEADDDQGDGLMIAQNGAASLNPTVISNSWGESEPTDSATLDSTYFTHPGIGNFVSSGDSGATGSASDYPSTGAHVIAVGGTSLVKSSNARGWTEGAWSSAGSACSLHIAKPSWQTNSVCTKRAAADVSAVADPNTGVAVFNAGSGGWIVVGGTSASAPFVAGVFARTGHGNASDASYAYSHASQFFDVTTGKNGSCGNALCNAGAGWDGPTGLGSPNAGAMAGGTCTPSCTGKNCGPDGCGGSCGTCGAGQTCSAGGVCEGGGCTPNCTGKNCGDDGCGGSCGTCASGQTCSSGGTCTGGGGSCAHPICSTGVDLQSGCDPCATQICAVDSYCCHTAWDSICVGEVSSVCHQSCGGGTCAHPECSTGVKLTKGCDTCVGEICAQDSYCCNTKWDSLCVSEVSSICGESCN